MMIRMISRNFCAIATIMKKKTPKDFIRAVYPSLQEGGDIQHLKDNERKLNERIQEICLFSNAYELMNLTIFSNQLSTENEDLAEKFLSTCKKQIIRDQTTASVVSKTFNSIPIFLNSRTEEGVKIIFNYLVENSLEISPRVIPEYLVSLAKCKTLTLEPEGEVWEYLVNTFIKCKNDYTPESFITGLEGINSFAFPLGILQKQAIESYFWNHYLSMDKGLFMQYLKNFGELDIGSKTLWKFCEDLYFDLDSQNSIENIDNLEFMSVIASAQAGSENFWNKAQTNIDDLLHTKSSDLQPLTKIRLLINLCSIKHVSNEFLENLIFDISLEKIRKLEGNEVANLMVGLAPFVGERAPNYIWELLKTGLVEKITGVDPLLLLRVYEVSKEERLMSKELDKALTNILSEISSS